MPWSGAVGEGRDQSGAPPAGPPAPRTDRIVRALLALAVWGCFGDAGWRLGGPLVGGGAALAAAVAWILWAAPNDPARPGRVWIAIPGPARLALEAALIGLAAAGVWATGSRAVGETLLTVVGLHAALTWERAAALLGRRGVGTARSGQDEGRARG